MNNKKNILSLLSFITVLLITLRIYDLEYKNAESLVLITNFLIILISLIFMFKGDKYNYGLNKIFYLFSFFFFGISPGIEYILNVNYWRGKPLSSSSYLKMNITIIIILIIYQILYIIFSKIKILKIEKKFINYFKKKFKLNTRIKWKFYIISIVILAIVLYFNKFNLKSIFLRGGDRVERIKVEKMSLNKSLMLGLLFIFPLLDEMRRFKSIDQIKLGFKFTMFLEGHFDSYQNFMRVIENNIITNGN